MSLFRKILVLFHLQMRKKRKKTAVFFPTRTVCLSMNNLFITSKKTAVNFIYCENLEEVKEHFENILQENDWYESNVLL
jgi:hypothetical protein